MDSYVGDIDVNYYNCSFLIIQSYGMGKSRLVNHSTKLRFTLPFNLEKINDEGVKSITVFLVVAKHELNPYL
jgi:hypothetical protein